MKKVRLVKVISQSGMTIDGWKEMYCVIVQIGNKIDKFYSDLQNGVKAETQKVYNPKMYNYSCFESRYGRSPKNKC